ncbi:hypothetical protein HZA99_01460 [Candidatus Woesearchaeota archaeon]|nr:hypothetical protein [Candidatus Woesearchaeota archaeon]
MRDQLEEAYEELKRVDHLIYVSLKYTRTTDVLKNVIERMIATSECMMNAVAEHAKQTGKVKTFPIQPMMKCKELKRLYGTEQELNDFLEMYILLKTLSRAEYNSINEYRRHVTLIAQLEEGEYHVHIDKVTEFYKNLRRYMEYIKSMM